MTDTLEIFGTEYSGVTGIKATDDNSNTKTYIRPQGTVNITQAGTTDVTNYATATVPSGSLGTEMIDISKTSLDYDIDITFPDFSAGYISTSPTATVSLDIEDKSVSPSISQQVITPTDTTCYLNSVTVSAMPSGTAGTPTATKGAVSNHSISVTPSVTNTAGYISGGTKTGAAVTVSASELVSGTYTVDSSGTKDVTNYASASISALTLPSSLTNSASGTSVATLNLPNGVNKYLQIPKGYNNTNSYYQLEVPTGTAGTPTATKGAVSNHSVSVTPSVTNTTGYITGSTKTGTAVSVSASELVSGSQTITSNQTVDVTNLAEVVVNVSGGGTPMGIGGEEAELATTSNSITFTNLMGEPTSFYIYYEDSITPSATSYISALVFDGTTIHGQTVTNISNAQATYNGSSFTKSYSNGTLTITSTNPSFISGWYDIVYSYGGGAIDTKDVQVGSGATSITFTGLEDEPAYWSCIFKSNFGTSSGYQRVIWTGSDQSGTGVFGASLDSSTHMSSTFWTASYSNGSLTITSQGTNQGGYFHQPGYYQLTYAYDDGSSGNYQSKTVTPTTSQQVVEADSGYDALKKVTVNAIPSEYIVPSGNINITSNTATGQTLNVAQYASATVAVPSSGSSKNVQVLQSTSRTNSSSLTKVLGDLTVSKTGTYDIYWSGGRSNTSTSYTWGTRLYVDGTGYGTENTTWTNNCQSNHLSNVSLTANQKLSVYARGRTGSYYTFAPMLVIVEV